MDFSSDDRYELLPEGITKQVRWSTPLRNYRSFGAVRLASGGEGHWHEGDGEYTYIELTIDESVQRIAAIGLYGSLCVVLIWIAAQIAIIGYVSWMQPATLAGAVAVLILAHRDSP